MCKKRDGDLSNTTKTSKQKDPLKSYNVMLSLEKGCIEIYDKVVK